MTFSIQVEKAMDKKQKVCFMFLNQTTGQYEWSGENIKDIASLRRRLKFYGMNLPEDLYLKLGIETGETNLFVVTVNVYYHLFCFRCSNEGSL
jgi:hypothetical protein